MTIGEKIKQRRRDLKMSGDTLAKKLGVIRNTISRWEQGHRIPNVEMLKSIADSLETTPAYLIGDIDNQSEYFQFMMDKYSQSQTSDFIRLPVHDMETIPALIRSVGETVMINGELEIITITARMISSIDKEKPPMAVKMSNDSMSGANMDEEDYIIIDLATGFRSGDPSLIIYNDTAMIRWVCSKANGSIELQPANPNYKTIIVEPQYSNNPEVFKIIGRAVFAIAKKRIKQAF